MTVPFSRSAFGGAMREALRLTKARDLAGATRAIQQALGAGAAPAQHTPSSAAPSSAASSSASRRSLGETIEQLRGAVARRHARAPSVPPGASFEARDYAGSAGRRAYKLYTPSKPAAPERGRLIVVLHGCTQNADDIAAGTAMNALAEARGWHVLYPVQPKSANPTTCWNWFRPGDQTRERGEPAIIAGMVRSVMAERDLRPGRVAVAGMSAGAAMALILGATYPELFEAVGAHSGVAPGAARDVPSAFAAMRNGAPGDARAFEPRLIVFQGQSDAVVNPANVDAILAAALPAGASREVAQRSAGGLDYTHMVAMGADGRPRVESFRIEGLGHAWSGGDPAGSYADPRGPSASAEMLRFFDA